MEILQAWGISGWDDDRNIERLASAAVKHNHYEGAYDDLRVAAKLLAFLATPDNAIEKAKFEAWIPAPSAIADQGKHFFPSFLGLFDVLFLGCKAYLRLGHEEAAAELARIGISPEQQTVKKSELVSCYSILGQIAAKRGSLEDADGHFSNGLKQAKLSRLPMFEILAARDWQRHLLEPTGRDCSAAEKQSTPHVRG